MEKPIHLWSNSSSSYIIFSSYFLSLFRISHLIIIRRTVCDYYSMFLPYWKQHQMACVGISISIPAYMYGVRGGGGLRQSRAPKISCYIFCGVLRGGSKNWYFSRSPPAPFICLSAIKNTLTLLRFHCIVFFVVVWLSLFLVFPNFSLF